MTTQENHPIDQDAPLCPHCDDTGDVTRADGEWLGTCSCEAGDRIRAQASPAARGVAPVEAPSKKAE